jgi:hypothetical protein
VALFLVVILWPVASHWILVAWFLVVAAVYATRLMFIRAFFRENPQGDSAISWERWFCLSSLVSAVIFAESGVDIVLEKPADISQLIETMTVLAMTRKESGE